MHHSKIKKMSVALGMALLPISVFAAGLGQLNINSGIGEPLKADIELLSVTSAELATLKARIAPESAYAAQGIERTFLHGDIKVQVTRDSAGKRILKLTSNKPVTEPFLDMLVEVEWETGSILREYTVLLDPPGYKSEPAPASIETPTISAADNAPVKKAAAPIKKAPSTPKSTVSSASVTTQAPTDDYLTKRGDTLSKIASEMKPEGVSLDQMLVGLFEANPDAFVGKNMNRLKVGKILQPPSEEALNAITRRQAAKEIKLHTANWNEYRNKLAGIVAESAAEESEVDTQATSGKINPATQDDSVPESTGPKDVVKLSSATSSEAEADMQAKITALEEEVSAREKGLKEAQDRTAALEKQIEDLQKLLALKSDEMAQVQEQAAQAVADANKQAEEVTGEVKSAEEVAAEEVPVTQPEAVDEAKPEVAQAEQPAPQPETKPIPAPTPVPAPVEEAPSFISSILDNVTGVFKGLNATLIGAAGGLIALLLAGWFYLRNKRKKNLADFEQGIMTSGGLKANTVFGNTSGASVDTGDTSFLTDFSQSTSGGMIDTNDVDPIAEAEVYMAYGRDAQAEEILKDAIAKEPKRYELHLKLLEMYAASKNMSAFETVSGELYTTLGADDPTWAKVAEIGIKLEPNNPLYQVKAGMGGEAASDGGTSEETTETATDEKLDASDFSDSPLAEEADLDFSLNDIGIDAKTEPMNDTTTEQVAVEEIGDNVLEQAAAEPASEEDDTSLEFDLGAASEETDEAESVSPVMEDTNFAHTMPNLEFPKTQDEAQLEDDSLTLDVSQTNETIIEEAPLIQTDDAKTADEGFDFNIDTLTEDTITLDGGGDSEEALTQADEPSNVLDMSHISLDVNEDVNQAIDEATAAAETIEAEMEPIELTSEPDEIEAPSFEIEEEPVVETAPEVVEAPQISTEPESEEVETKLELVAAYIDMEDKEGAKELLEEVLKEGGPNQRKRAEEIMANIG